MNSTRVVAILVLAVVGLIVLSSSLYVIDMTQQVVVTQFGRPIGQPITTPGLRVKVPFVQKINVFDKRVLEWDGNPSQVPTKDKKYIWVDTFARWKIADPLKFMQSVSNEMGAHARLDDVIDAVTRDLITGHDLIEIVRDSNREMTASESYEETPTEQDVRIEIGRTAITREILKRAAEQMPRYGIELVDVEVKRVNYVEEVRRKVYERMISERQRIAERYRSEGRGQSAEIRGRKERELQRITSEAYQIAQELRGDADAGAAKVYADAFGRDPEFYTFLRTLESYRETIGSETTLILTTDSEYFKLLKSMSGR